MHRFNGAKENSTSTLSWDFDFALNDHKAEIQIPTSTRFGGEWTLWIESDRNYGITLTLQLRDLSSGTMSLDLATRWQISWLDGDEVARPIILAEDDIRDTFPRSADPHDFCLSIYQSMLPAAKHWTQIRLRAEFILEGHMPSAHSRDLAERTRRHSSNRTPSSRISAEVGSALGQKEHRGAKEVAAPAESTEDEGNETEQDSETRMDDSDEEMDDILCDMGLLKVEERTDDDDDNFTYRQITITHASYCTYLAVLLWLHTSYIDFADPTSSLPNDWRDSCRASFVESPQKLLFVSPKSVYRLAHLLDLPHLQALSLTAFKQKLTVDVAATELVSNTSLLYDEVRAVALDYVVKHWAGKDGVKKSAGMDEVRRRVREGELPRGGDIMAELLMRLA